MAEKPTVGIADTTSKSKGAPKKATPKPKTPRTTTKQVQNISQDDDNMPFVANHKLISDLNLKTWIIYVSNNTKILKFSSKKLF